MKKQLLCVLTAVILLLVPALSFAQAPSLGTAANFVLFSSAGPVTSTNSVDLPKLTGNVGTNGSTVTSGFGNIDGQIHDNDGVTIGGSGQAATDLLAARDEIITLGNGTVISHVVGLGNGEILTKGVYTISAAATLGGVLTLNSTATTDVFIFIIDGSLSVDGTADVTFTGGTTACNVFWQTNGVVSIVAGAKMKGTIIAKSGAINMTGVTLEGRALAVTGTVSLDGSTARIPIGCASPNLSPTLTGPTYPTLASTECYVLFTTTGAMTNSNAAGLFTGDIGSNSVAPVGFIPANVTGTIHSPGASTLATANELGTLYTYLNTLTTDITLLYPQQLGNDLVLTPHTYNMTAAALLTGNLYLNAQGNADAVFVIKVSGALTTAAGAAIILQNQAQSKNVFWKVTGAVGAAAGSSFRGTIVNTGDIGLSTTVALDGRGLTTAGAVSTAGSPAIMSTMPTGCSSTGIASYNNGNTETVTIAPNPFSTSTTIMINDASQINNCIFKMYNVLGEEVMNANITKQITTLETSNLPSGIYFYKIIGNNKTIQSGKLVSQQ
ncbi:MAG: ice-binding family protein [Bacteroidales bacterium]|jgi:hypothetical protein